MYILGINAHHAGSSACLIENGQLVAAAEEERFKRQVRGMTSWIGTNNTPWLRVELRLLALIW